MKRIKYLTEKKVEEYNKLILSEIKVRKADQPKLLSKEKLKEAINLCKQTKGDIFDKACVLLVELICLHPFASGNRRTAIVSVQRFLEDNGNELRIKTSASESNIFTGIREGFYTFEEVKKWIKNGKIKKFERWSEPE